MNEYGSLIARACLSAVFIWSGTTKLLDPISGAAEVAALHLPAPRLFLALTIVCQIAAGLMVLFGLWTRTAAVVLLGFTVTATMLARLIPLTQVMATVDPADDLKAR